MLKYNFNKKSKSFMLNLLFCGCSFSCFAGNPDTNKENATQQNYLTHSISSFFATKQTDQSKAVNSIYSPFGADSCLATFAKTQYPLSPTKEKLTNKLISLGIQPNMPLYSAPEAKLQLLTAILTRDEVTQKAHNELNTSKVFLGEHLLKTTDQTNSTLKNLRHAFKEKIENALAQKFGENLNLDYSTFWSNTGSPASFLKVISAIKFQDEWRGEPFENIGLGGFNTADNQHVQTEFMEKTISGKPVKDDASNWQAIRLFYKQQYALDIILPAENSQCSIEQQQQIINSLVNKLNHTKIKHRDETLVRMPLFEDKKQLDLSKHIISIIGSSYEPNYKGFLVDTDHDNFLDASQKCYIKIDEKGTTAEALTDMCCTDSAAFKPPVLFEVNRSYFFILSEYNAGKYKFDYPITIDRIIMMGEVTNPKKPSAPRD